MYVYLVRTSTYIITKYNGTNTARKPERIRLTQIVTSAVIFDVQILLLHCLISFRNNFAEYLNTKVSSDNIPT